MPTSQLSLFDVPSSATHAADGPAVPQLTWTHDRVERSGDLRYVHLVRAPGDPERRPRPAGGVEDKAPHLTLAKTTTKRWRGPLRRQLADGMPRSFNRLAVEVLDLTADVAFETPFDEALWDLVARGEVEHTLESPVLFRRRPARAATCKPCRDDSHHDHHWGIWARADGSDPVICLCSRCEPAGT